jgi:aryl-phospho-beta-D-glucosidase BglC (GH1 family)
MVFDKLKNLVSASLEQCQSAPPGNPPSRKDIIQNRQNFGVNFGSLYLQEKFIFERFFCGYGNEYEGMSQYVKDHGMEQAQKDLESHWAGYISDAEWNWLRDIGVTGIRVPLGYWHIKGGVFTQGTPFESLRPVYQNAWSSFIQLVKKANEYDIGVIMDLHAVPGGANTSEHSGVPLKRAEFWHNTKFHKLALDALEFITRDLSHLENIIGIQIVNESEFSNDAKSQKQFYINAVKTIRKHDKHVPIIISDGWWLNQWCEWLQKVSNDDSGVVIDTHVYRCFSDADKSKSPEQIIQDLETDCITGLSYPADVMVGEYSCVLDGRSWEKTNDRDGLVKRYGQKQSELFIQRANMGSFFWTFKFQHGDGGEWGFVPMVKNGAILTRFSQVWDKNQDQFNDAFDHKVEEHYRYWDNQGGKYEHWRYKEGFVTGWADARNFAYLNGSRLGRRCWIKSRLMEHVDTRGKSDWLWEYEQGYQMALKSYWE